MYETGHIAIGIICGKLVDQAIGTKSALPLLCLFAVLPDMDIFHPFGTKHGGATHSICLIVLAFLPLLLLYDKAALPYLASILSHPLIGDILFQPTRILWPLGSRGFGLGLAMNSEIHVFMEYSSWLIAIVLLARLDSLETFLEPNSSSPLIVVPLFALLFTFILAPKSLMPLPTSIILLHVGVAVVLSCHLIVWVQKMILTRE